MSDIVETARTWLGVPWQHRGRSRLGVDCVGLPRCVYAELGVELPDFLLYGREPQPAVLEAHMTAALRPPVQRAPVARAQLQLADIVVLRHPSLPRHVGIVGDYPGGRLSLIHACGHTKKVIEHRLPDKMIRRVTLVYRRPI